MAIVLNNITSGYNLVKINANFQNIEDYINQKLLARAITGVAGEAMMERALDMNGNKILNVFVDINDPDSLLTVGVADSRYYNVSGDTLTGTMNANGQIINNLPSPSVSSQAATKGYVDELASVVSNNNGKVLRFPDNISEAYSTAPARANSLQGYNSDGNPVPIFAMTDTADLALKLASTTSGLGGELVGWKRSNLSATISTLSRFADAHPIFCYEHADVITDKPTPNDPTTWDWTPAIDAAIAKSKSLQFQPVILPHHAFVTTGGHIPTSNTPEFSGGSATDGRKYKGVPIIGYGPEITKARFKPASSSSICFSLVGNSGGHKTACYLRDFSIEPYDSSYQFLGYGIQLNSVNYARIESVDIYMLNENFRLLNGIATGWTEFNSFTNCFSYRGNVCYSFVRTLGNDSFHGTEFTNCFGQIKRTGTGGYGIKATGVSSSALVWVYNSKLDIKFYGGDAVCKAISLSFAEMTINHGDMTCEGTVTMEALDDFSRVRHLGRWINNGTTLFSVVTELTGAQGRFVFTNLASRNVQFTSTELTGFTPSAILTSPESYSVNGAYPAVFQGTGTNFASPMVACLNQSGNGFYFGQISSSGSLSDFTPTWKLTNDGGILKSYNTTFRFQLGSTETYRISTTSIFPFTSGAMQLGTSTNRWGDAYLSTFTVNNTGFVPTAAATYNIASASTPVNNIYSQNAVTVISDENYKDSISQISDSDEMELLVEAVGSVPFSFWKLKTAIALKGDDARWHVGVIAQQVRDAIVAKGLDWTKYGLITYDKHSQVVALGVDGFYYPVLEEGELSSVATNELGYITAIDGADSITEVDGVITYSRETYMLRMEEFLTLRMAYIESKLV